MGGEAGNGRLPTMQLEASSLNLLFASNAESSCRWHSNSVSSATSRTSLSQIDVWLYEAGNKTWSKAGTPVNEGTSENGSPDFGRSWHNRWVVGRTQTQGSHSFGHIILTLKQMSSILADTLMRSSVSVS